MRRASDIKLSLGKPIRFCVFNSNRSDFSPAFEGPPCDPFDRRYARNAHTYIDIHTFLSCEISDPQKREQQHDPSLQIWEETPHDHGPRPNLSSGFWLLRLVSYHPSCILLDFAETTVGQRTDALGGSHGVLHPNIPFSNLGSFGNMQESHLSAGGGGGGVRRCGPLALETLLELEPRYPSPSSGSVVSFIIHMYMYSGTVHPN